MSQIYMKLVCNFVNHKQLHSTAVEFPREYGAVSLHVPMVPKDTPVVLLLHANTSRVTHAMKDK